MKPFKELLAEGVKNSQLENIHADLYRGIKNDKEKHLLNAGRKVLSLLSGKSLKYYMTNVPFKVITVKVRERNDIGYDYLLYTDTGEVFTLSGHNLINDLTIL